MSFAFKKRICHSDACCDSIIFSTWSDPTLCCPLQDPRNGYLHLGSLDRRFGKKKLRYLRTDILTDSPRNQRPSRHRRDPQASRSPLVRLQLTLSNLQWLLSAWFDQNYAHSSRYQNVSKPRMLCLRLANETFCRQYALRKRQLVVDNNSSFESRRKQRREMI